MICRFAENHLFYELYLFVYSWCNVSCIKVFAESVFEIYKAKVVPVLI
jgi:hypothetical protein